MVNANYLHGFSSTRSITSSLKHSLKSQECWDFKKVSAGSNLEHILDYWAPLEMWHVVNIILAALISFIGYWIVWCRAVPLPRPGWGPPAGHGRAMGLQGTSPGLALSSAASPSPYLYWAQPRPDTGHCSDIIIRLTKIAYNVRFNMVKNELNRFWVYAFSFNI